MNWYKKSQITEPQEAPDVQDKNHWTKEIDNKPKTIGSIYRNILEYLIDKYQDGHFSIEEAYRDIETIGFSSEIKTLNNRRPSDPLKNLFNWGYLEIVKNYPPIGRLTDKGLST